MVVPYASMKAAYNNIGISDNSNESAANYDGVGDSFSAQALAAGNPDALTPGGTVTIEGTRFTWPNVPAGTPDNVVDRRVRPSISAAAERISGSSAQARTAPRAGPSRSTTGMAAASRSTSTWPTGTPNAPAVGNQLVTTTSSWNFQSNSLGPHPVSVYFASVPLEHGQDGLVGDAARVERRRRHHRHAHLCDGGRQRHPDDGRALLVARRRLRQCRDQRQLGSVGRQLRRHRGELLQAGSRRRHADAADPGRSGDDRRDDLHVANPGRRA